MISGTTSCRNVDRIEPAATGKWRILVLCFRLLTLILTNINRRFTMFLRWQAAILLSSFLWLSSLASAQVCNQAPLASPDTTEAFLIPILIDVLANDTEPDGEVMSVLLQGGTCASVGTVTLILDVVQLTPPGTGLAAPCTIFYRVADESGNVSSMVTVTVDNQFDPIFVDGFESGTTSAWSAVCNICPEIPE
jgi:hypothetical protein